MSTKPCIYLDNSATTPVCDAAVQAAATAMTTAFGNPSSLHTLGVEAERRMTAARTQVAALLGATPERIVFTSGGTESNNLAILGAAAARRRAGRHIVTTAIEHASVLAACAALEADGAEITRLVPGPDGLVTPDQVAQACRQDTVVVSIQLVNHEMGARQPLEDIVPVVRKHAPQAVLHCDAVQAAGKLPLRAERWGVDLMSCSAHKIHGPKGCGAVYVRRGVRVLPLLYGGGQEGGLRPGTESVPLIAAFGAAAAALPAYDIQAAQFTALRERLCDGLAKMDNIVINSPAAAVPYIVNLSVPGLRSETLLHALAARGIYVSSGSACSRGKRSPVLTALGLPSVRIDSALRVSLSHTNTPEDIDTFLAALQETAATLRRA